MILVRSVIYFVAMVLTVVVFGSTIGLFGWFLPTRFSDVLATRWGLSSLARFWASLNNMRGSATSSERFMSMIVAGTWRMIQTTQANEARACNA